MLLQCPSVRSKPLRFIERDNRKQQWVCCQTLFFDRRVLASEQARFTLQQPCIIGYTRMPTTLMSPAPGSDNPQRASRGYYLCSSIPPATGRRATVTRVSAC